MIDTELIGSLLALFNPAMSTLCFCGYYGKFYICFYQGQMGLVLVAGEVFPVSNEMVIDKL